MERYIPRSIEKTILAYLHRKEIIAVVGPRQCGKTTTLRRIFQTLSNASFLTFEDRDVLSLFEHDIKAFAETYLRGKQYVFIDEFQYARQGGKNLKYLYDTHPSKLIISGSSAIDLTIRTLKYLVGRVLILEMYPFDFMEFVQSQNADHADLLKRKNVSLCSKRFGIPRLAPEQEKIFTRHYEDYITFGGYPAVVLASGEDEKKALLKNIYNTYLLRDVKTILGLADDYKLSRLIRALSLQVGNLIELHELSQVSEWSIPTLKKYLNFLSKTYICDFVRPFYVNKRKEIVKSQKVYFHDMGLRNIILNDFRRLDTRLDSGALVENALWTQFKKHGITAQYWRDKNKNEIDFIVDCGASRIVALEVKLQLRKYVATPLPFSRLHPDVVAFFAYLYSAKAKQRDHALFIPLL